MNPAREEILMRIREALGIGASSPNGLPHQPDFGGDRSQALAEGDSLLSLLRERIEDYRATVIRCPARDLPTIIAERMRLREATDLVIPSDLPDSWLETIRGSGGLEGPAETHWPLFDVKRDQGSDPLSKSQLDSAQAVLTGCALAIAETGTLVLDGGATQGRRALSLVPDFHLCVVFQDQVVRSVPEGVQSLMSSLHEAPRPFTLISGPSATSDIELIRVEGVHGPRILDVILVEDS